NCRRSHPALAYDSVGVASSATRRALVPRPSWGTTTKLLGAPGAPFRLTIWLYEKHATEADVRLLPGVFGVTNAIATKQGSEASELRDLGMATRGPPNVRRHLRSEVKPFAMVLAGRHGYFGGWSCGHERRARYGVP